MCCEPTVAIEWLDYKEQVVKFDRHDPKILLSKSTSFNLVYVSMMDYKKKIKQN